MENNIEKSFPFDAQNVDGKYDRTYVADDFARYFRAFISSGLFMEVGSSLQVLANDDMTVTLKPGAMVIDGYRYDAVDDIIIPISPADGLMDRIDRISVTWSRAERDIHYTIQEGDFAYEPVAPACRRSAEYKDYVVADVYVAANSIAIKQSVITDQRLNSEVCGLAAPFEPFDSKLIFDQLQAFYKETVAENAQWTREEKGKFERLMELMRGLLDEEAASHLQMQIDSISRELIEQKEGIQHMVTDAFSVDADYAEGDYCIYDNTLYQFTAAKDTGPWNPEVVQESTVMEQISVLNGRLTDADTGDSFRFGVTEDGQPGYHWKDEEGADTVLPFSSGGDTSELYEALKYSGLVTPDMSFDEMCEALAAHWPAYLDLFNTGESYGNWIYIFGGGGGGTGDDPSTMISHGFGSTIYISASGYWLRGAYYVEFDLTPYNTLSFYCTGVTRGSESSVRCGVKSGTIPSVSTSKLTYDKSINVQTGENTLDISSLSGNYFVALDLETGNKQSASITLTQIRLSV